MDSSRLAQLDDNQLVTRLNDVFAQIEDIKNRQFSGGDVITPKLLDTGNQYDLIAVQEFSVWGIDMGIEFIADHQIDPYIYPVVQFFDLSGNRIPQNNIQIIIYDLFTQDGPPNGNWHDGKAWIDFFAQNTTQFQVKVYLLASDSGQIILNNYDA